MFIYFIPLSHTKLKRSKFIDDMNGVSSIQRLRNKTVEECDDPYATKGDFPRAALFNQNPLCC